MIQQRRADRPVPAKTNVVGKPGLVEVGVKRRRDGPGTIQLLLVAAAVGKEELVVDIPILVYAERRGSVMLGSNGAKDKIVGESERWIGVDGEERKHLLRDRAEVGDFVSRERSPTLHSSYRLCRGGIENLAQPHLAPVARIDHRCAVVHQNRAEQG